MEASEVEALRLRVRRSYELGRARRALVVLVPILALGALAWRLGGDAWGPVLGGGMLSLVAVVFLWRGQRAGSVVLPAMVAGALPYACALWARCGGESTSGVCMLACFAGSVVAGLVVSRLARHSGAPMTTWGCAGTIATLTGAIGCACVGLAGLIGLVAGLGVVAVPSLLVRPRPST